MRLRAISLAAGLIGLAAAVALAVMFALPELTVVSVASALLLILSAAWLRIGVGGFANTVELSTSHRAVHVGDEAELVVEIRNARSAASMPAELRYNRTDNNTATNNTATRNPARLGVGPLDPGGTCGFTISLDTSRRGVHQIGGWFWYLRDPLRLWRHRDPIPSSAVLNVRPRAHPLDSPQGLGSLTDPQGRSSSVVIPGEPDGDLIGLRPYTPGDDMRLIHWRTSARLNQPHVIQTDPPPTDAVFQMLVDTHIDREHTTTADASAHRRLPPSEAAFERSLEATVSIALHLAASGSSIRLRTTGGWDSGSVPPGAISTILDWLTSAKPTTAATQATDPALPRTFTPDVAVGTDHRSIQAAIAHPTPARPASHPHARPPTAPPTRILVCPPSGNDPMRNGPTGNGDESSGPVVTWGTNEPLAHAWARLITAGGRARPDTGTRVGP